MQREEPTVLLPDSGSLSQPTAGPLWTAERAFLEEVLRQMHKGVIVATPAGRLILVNAQVGQIWGQPLAPATTRDLYAAYQGSHPDERPYAPEEWPLDRSLRTGEVVNDEAITFTHGDSTPGVLLVNSAPVRDPAGRIVAAVMTFSDRTARLRAAADLQRSTQRLRTLRELDQAILATQPPEAVAQTALGYMRQLLDCEEAEVVIWDAVTGTATVLAADCAAGDSPVRGTRIALEEPDLALAYAQGGGRIVIDAAEAARIPTALGGSAVGAPGAYLSVLLRAGVDVLGVLNLWAAAPDGFQPPDLEVATEVANELAIAIHNGHLLTQLQESHARLQQLSRRLLAAQEQERQRLAHELHDQIGQVLTAVQLNIEGLQNVPAEVLTARLHDSSALIARTLQQIRDLSLDLRPSLLDDLGLVSALHWYVSRQAQRTGLAIRLEIEPLPARFPDDLEIACFRIAQEALTNVLRHAAARQVTVALHRRGSALELEVRDDGVGFDPAAVQADVHSASLGLLGMRERAELTGGQLTIEAAPAQGTTVRARFPWPVGTGGA